MNWGPHGGTREAGCQFNFLPHCIPPDPHPSQPPPPPFAPPNSAPAFLGQLLSFCTTQSITNPGVRAHLCPVRLYCSCFFWVGGGVDPALGLSIYSLRACVCMCVCVLRAHVHVTECLHASVSVWICKCARACAYDPFSGITGFWAVLSVDSVVSSGPAAPSSAGWSNEMWQTGPVLSRALARAIVSPSVARLLQGRRRRPREPSHMLANVSEQDEGASVLIIWKGGYGGGR